MFFKTHNTVSYNQTFSLQHTLKTFHTPSALALQQNYN